MTMAQRVISVLLTAFLATVLAMPGTIAFGQVGPGIITTFVGSSPCHATEIRGEQVYLCGGGFSGDGGPAAKAELSLPAGLAVDASGNPYIADQANHRIRRVDARTGMIATVAGSGACRTGSICTGGFSGDGGRATSAELNFPGGVALDADDNLFIADTRNNRIRRVDHATGIITTVAGYGTADNSGDGGPATNAELNRPQGLAVDKSGNLFIADTGNNRIRRVDKTTGFITTVAGDGTCCSGLNRGDGGPAIKAALDRPYTVLVDFFGNLLIADYFNYSIRRVDHATGIVTSVAGNLWHNRQSGRGFSGDGGPARDAQLTSPTAIATDASGNLFIADAFNRHIRRVNHASGVITTVAGSVVCNPTPIQCDGSFGGDDGPATSAILSFPFGVAVDAEGNLFIADTGNNRVRRVHLEQVVPEAGLGHQGRSPDAVTKK